MNNVKPYVEVTSVRVGGANYQVPSPVDERRGYALAIRWVINAAQKRSGRSMIEKLAEELFDAANHRGVAIKKREDTHKMAEANKAFAHFAQRSQQQR
jgi:small subunit ribosomal protein S7